MLQGTLVAPGARIPDPPNDRFAGTRLFSGKAHGVLAVMALAMAAWACEDGMAESATMTSSSATYADVTPEAWSRLSARRVFFGHQSVGGNLLDGVSDLAAAGNDVIEVRDAAASPGLTEPGLYHARLGRNGSPETKLADFAAAVNAAAPGPLTAAMKFCYVDVTADTDPTALFEAYRRTVDELRAARPDLTVVHVTMPLLRDRGTLRHFAAAVRGLGSGREVNAVRHRYNELLRTEYAGREPVFDLARIEATGADGELRTIGFGGQRVEVLAPEWTNDGGHLNEAGRKRAAAEFLALLASL